MSKGVFNGNAQSDDWHMVRGSSFAIGQADPPIRRAADQWLNQKAAPRRGNRTNIWYSESRGPALKRNAVGEIWPPRNAPGVELCVITLDAEAVVVASDGSGCLEYQQHTSTCVKSGNQLGGTH